MASAKVERALEGAKKALQTLEDAVRGTTRGRRATRQPAAPGEILPAPGRSRVAPLGEREQIIDALEAEDWIRIRAARRLGWARRTFYRRAQAHGIIEPRPTPNAAAGCAS